MKKIAVLVIALVLVLLTANTALAKFVDDSDKLVTSGTNSVDVKIIERTKTSNQGLESSSEVLDGVSKADETLQNLAPGDKIILSYKIINTGSYDAMLDGINISIDNQELMKYITLKWTLTKYKDSYPINSVSNSVSGSSLLESNGFTDVSSTDIVLYRNDNKDDYCLLELEITLDDNTPLSSTVQETVFVVTPSFVQN